MAEALFVGLTPRFETETKIYILRAGGKPKKGASAWLISDLNCMV